jgi:hypothetical protein
MANYEKFIINDLIRNELIITFPDNDAEPITEENIAFESMSLKRSICDSEALIFGGCIASEFSIDLINTGSRSFSEGLGFPWKPAGRRSSASWRFPWIFPWERRRM